MKVYLNDLPNDALLAGDLAIDTEAMGLKLSRDRLAMIQICDEAKNVYLIHFPDGNYDYSCPNLQKILLDEKRQKIFHFARFDISIMKYYLQLKKIPNIYCTKIASRFARTYTDSHSLRALVGEILKIDLKKEQQCSYWGNPELSEAQKNYASSDVIYLHSIREKLNQMLQKTNRMTITNEYFSFLDTISNSDMMGFDEDIFRHRT